MSTPLENGTARWLLVGYVSDKHTKEIEAWIKENDLDIRGCGMVVNPQTFEPVQKWFVTTEEEKTFFLLKWS